MSPDRVGLLAGHRDIAGDCRVLVGRSFFALALAFRLGWRTADVFRSDGGRIELGVQAHGRLHECCVQIGEASVEIKSDAHGSSGGADAWPTRRQRRTSRYYPAFAN